MKKILFIVFTVVLCSLIAAQGAGFDLPEVLDPDSIFVQGDTLYVVESDSCRMYSLSRGKYLGSFCKPGEGPGEVKTMPGLSAGISATPEGKILLEGMNKILYFTPGGEFISEQKKGGRFFRVNGAGNNLIALGMTVDGKNGKSHLTLSAFSGDSKLLRELYRQEMKDNDKDIEMVIKTIRYSVWNNRIYIASNENGNPVIVFDPFGNELYRFTLETKTEKVSDEFKKEEFRRLKDDDFISMMVKREGGWENFRKRMNFIFPDSLPAVREILVSHNRVHLLTYERENGKKKFIITGLKGEKIISVFLPVPMQSSFLATMLGRENKFYAFSSDRYYFLSEDEESETFTLNVIRLKGLK